MRSRALVLLGALACAPAQPAGNGADTAPRPATTAADTLSGIVRVVGADPATWLAIYPTYAPAASLSGPAAELLRSVSGAEVWVSGRALGTDFEVAHFVVRAVDSRPVHDGMLTRSGGRLVVELTGGGSLTLENPPPQLDALVGSRIWVSQPALGEGLSYGAIRRQ